MVRYSFALALVLTALSRAAAGPVLVPPGIVPPNAPKSTFINELGFGKDPFFPESSRIQPPAAVDPNPTRPNVPEFISCKGISINQGKKLAIINNYTVAEGEEFTLRYANQITKVKLIEIKDRLVVVEVNGVSKELPLRASLN